MKINTATDFQKAAFLLLSSNYNKKNSHVNSWISSYTPGGQVHREINPCKLETWAEKEQSCIFFIQNPCEDAKWLKKSRAVP